MYLVSGPPGVLRDELVARLRARGSVQVVDPPEGPNGVPASTGARPAEAEAEVGAETVEAFHLAVGADLGVRAGRVSDVVTATAVALERAAACGATRFHLVTSALVAGATAGPVPEEEPSAWGPSGVPLVAALREAEALVRDQDGLAWRIYRPGVVVGRDDGEADGLDPLSVVFGIVRRLGELVPSWVPLPAADLGEVPVAPADFVAAAVVHAAHRDGFDGRTLHLPGETVAVIDLLNGVAALAGAPRLVWPVDAATLARLVPADRLPMLQVWPRTEVLAASLLENAGVSPAVSEVAVARTRFDHANADAALAGSGIEARPLSATLRARWRHWQDALDPRLHRPSLADVVAGRNVLVTGASFGIGRSLALRLGAAGASVVLAARTEEALIAVRDEIVAAGGRAEVHAVDLGSPAAAAELAAAVVATHGSVDVLVNNAALSINRPVIDSVGRFHDFERTITLNYLSAVALALGVLPAMQQTGRGHVINVLTGAVQVPSPGFAAYGASKAALANFGDVLRTELGDDGIAVTNVYMGLVHTGMSDPTEAFRSSGAMTADGAAGLIADAIVERPEIVVCEPLAALHGALWTLWPAAGAGLMRAVAREVPWRRAPEGGV